ncbi:MAG: lipopolysaccharide transport system permease protein [Gaiellaceae bacterium]|nr:lipopolysaccharide transport system permease protein [Gaiellaceae bacterium]
MSAVAQAPVAPATTYDSAERSTPLLRELRNLWRFRGLLGVLVVRNVTVRYKRSLLGVWWTLLNPLLTMGVMWIVFSQVFRFATGDVPYLVYLLSGLVVFTFFSTTVTAVANSILGGSTTLAKIYVPAEVFAVAATAAAGVNFVVSLLPLLVAQVATGTGIPWTIVLLPVPAFFVACLATGVGLALAPSAVRFGDVLQLTTLGLFLLGFLTPTFYPLAMVAPQFRNVLEANPLYHALRVFRDLAYGGTLGPWSAWVVLVGSSVVALAVGGRIFARTWRSTVVAL